MTREKKYELLKIMMLEKKMLIAQKVIDSKSHVELEHYRKVSFGSTPKERIKIFKEERQKLIDAFEFKYQEKYR